VKSFQFWLGFCLIIQLDFEILVIVRSGMMKSLRSRVIPFFQNIQSASRFHTGQKRILSVCLLFFFALSPWIYGNITQTLTPHFSWSAFEAGSGGYSQAGYQIRVYRAGDDALVYDTGFMSDTSGHEHTYSPGTYTGTDPITSEERLSLALESNQRYYLNVRYRDTNGEWGYWATESLEPRTDFFTATSSTAQVSVLDSTSPTDVQITVNIDLVAVPGFDIADYSFDLNFDSPEMAFLSYQTTSSLSNNWTITTNDSVPGVVSIQANQGTGSVINASGTLLQLAFNASGVSGASSNCTISNVSGGLLGYFAASGSVSFYRPGDVNLDDDVTPGDAQIAFETFIFASALPSLQLAAADINTDGDVTASDAALIFGIYLPTGGGLSAIMNSINRKPSAPPNTSGSHFTISEAKSYVGQEVVLKAAVIGMVDVRAYGFDLTYDAGLLEFLGVDKTGTMSQAWSSILSNVIAPGKVRIGGYNGAIAPINGDGILINIRFKVKSDKPQTTTISITKLFDGLSGAAGHDGQVRIVKPPKPPRTHDTPPTPVVDAPPVIESERMAYFVLDDFGAIHSGGAATLVELKDGPYFGWDIARGMELVFGSPTSNDSKLGVAILDGLGALHTFSCERPDQKFYFYPEPGDIAVDLALFQLDEVSATIPAGSVATEQNNQAMETGSDRKGMPGAIGFYVVDKTGRLWAGGSADQALADQASIFPPLNGITHRAVDITLADTTGKSGWVLDNMGNVYPFGSAQNPMFPLSDNNTWVDLEIVDEQLVRMDSSGNLEWSVAPIENWQLPQVDGELMVDLEVEPGLGLVALDRYGAIYTSGEAIRPLQGQGPPTLGMECARDLEISIALLEPKPPTPVGYDPNTFTGAVSGRYNPVNWAYSLPTGMDLQIIDTALQKYFVKNLKYPGDMQTFLRDSFPKRYEKVAFDSWGSPYYLVLKGPSEYYLVSSGPDKTLQTKDDLYIHQK
jgi:Cohesin domain/Dockerin type I domain